MKALSQARLFIQVVGAKFSLGYFYRAIISAKLGFLHVKKVTDYGFNDFWGNNTIVSYMNENQHDDRPNNKLERFTQFLSTLNN